MGSWNNEYLIVIRYPIIIRYPVVIFFSPVSGGLQSGAIRYRGKEYPAHPYHPLRDTHKKQDGVGKKSHEGKFSDCFVR